ncbi:MAG TPA: alternative ribosome rescue aminoacyl-tRNA hydrolase ArfB [Steroidobacteraceae bacterium]|nr:alternative ribosome rescue aminoacyl-tRNA hydrolase ArfB [Steroidobacteraceae bacterium]
MSSDFAPEEVEIQFVRSSGPGGQNVNKVATAAQLRFHVGRSARLDAAAKQRLRRLAGHRLTDADEILIIARNHRTQEGNRRDALDRLAALLDAARRAPVPRRATKPTRASKERRLSSKARSGRNKRLRGRVRGDD